jgi:ribonuclease P protein component
MNTFKKSDRLCSKKLIEKLFTQGKTFLVFPLRIVWLPVQHESSLQVVISVPKHNFHKAVQRNLIRRRIREAYRKNKQGVTEELEKKNQAMAFIIIYTGKEIATYAEIESKIILILQRLTEEYESYCA